MSQRYFGLVPAAGGGTRFGHDLPKQYAPIGGVPMLKLAVAALAAAPQIETVFVVLAPGDDRFRSIEWGSLAARIEPLYCGGPARRESVLNGLVALADLAEAEDWVLVHDAARPCLAREDLLRLIDEAGGNHAGSDAGGLLAVRVSDTIKRDDSAGAVERTVPRDRLWQAQTPQMFRYALLLSALRAAATVTDESAAVEAMGLRPRLVPGSPRNLKVTYPEDLELASLIIRAQGKVGI